MTRDLISEADCAYWAKLVASERDSLKSHEGWWRHPGGIRCTTEELAAQRNRIIKTLALYDDGKAMAVGSA